RARGPTSRRRLRTPPRTRARRPRRSTVRFALVGGPSARRVAGGRAGRSRSAALPRRAPHGGRGGLRGGGSALGALARAVPGGLGRQAPGPRPDLSPDLCTRLGVRGGV